MRVSKPRASPNYFFIIFLIGALLFSGFSLMLYRQFSDTNKADAWAINNYEVLRTTRLILTDLINMETGVRGYLITADSVFLEPYGDSIAAIKLDVENLHVMLRDNPLAESELHEIFENIGTLNALFKSDMDILSAHGKSAITKEVLLTQKAQMDHLRILIDGFIQKSLNELNAKLIEAHEKSREFVVALALGTALAIGAMFLATLTIASLTKRRQLAEETARESEDRFMTVMNGVNDGLFDFDMAKRTIYYSPAYKRMLGYEDQEYPNTLEIFKENLHPDDHEATFKKLPQYRSREIPSYNNIFRMRHKDGTWRWILSRGVGIWDKRGELTRLIGTHTDITEQKQREEELAHLNDELESFTYITSHDLRSPLVNLKGFAGEMEMALKQVMPVLARIEPELSPDERKIFTDTFETEVPEALGFIKKSVEKMDMLTSAVLDLSRIGKREFHFEALQPETLVERCMDTLAYEIAQKEAEITCEPLLQVISDRFALEQVFGNLLDNAVKYLSPKRKGKIVISSQRQGKDIIFSIKDNGRGIDNADRQKIFEVFRRARNTGDVRGLGMGMAYVKASVRKLGGAIWFDSVVDEGTTFSFRLPADGRN